LGPRATAGDHRWTDYGEPFERFDPVSGLPLPEPDDDADAQLAAALREFAEARDELRELRWREPATPVSDDAWPEVP
jgi:hypothetical protein